jgi:3-hydroxy acid dehydrogenase / malonic semialdehyde reductase
MSTAMGKRLQGKTIVITGASSGIGKATAIEFSRTSPSNLKLILTARRIDKIKEVAEEIKKDVGDGVKVHPVKLDMSKAEEIRSFVPNLPQEFKDIDVLVNNAGMVKGVDKAGDISEPDINIMFETNVTGLINMTQAVLGVMRSRGESGQGDIINIGSIAGREGYPGGSIYCATKAAVRTFTEAMRKELIATRIRVVEIDPGQVETEFSLVRFGGDKEKADAVYKGVTPLTGEDIAETIVFAAGRPENVVIADMLVFPNHQVRVDPFSMLLRVSWGRVLTKERRRQHRSCIGDHKALTDDTGGRSFAVQEAVHVETVNKQALVRRHATSLLHLQIHPV